MKKTTYLKKFYRITLILTPFFLLFPITILSAQHKVTRVIDGDTIVVNYNGKSEKVRLLSVNTPESVHPDKKQNIPMGKVASDYTKVSLENKYVDLEFEGGPIRGRFGRLLAYIFVDGTNFNLQLVRQGLSPYYTKYGLSHKYDQQFRKAERYAREHQLNIWADPFLAKKYLRLKSKWGQHKVSVSSSPPATHTKNWKYVASKKSKIFHHPYCQWALKIHPSNLIGFNTRKAATKSGRRPCKICNP